MFGLFCKPTSASVIKSPSRNLTDKSRWPSLSSNFVAFCTVPILQLANVIAWQYLVFSGREDASMDLAG